MAHQVEFRCSPKCPIKKL